MTKERTAASEVKEIGGSFPAGVEDCRIDRVGRHDQVREVERSDAWVWVVLAASRLSEPVLHGRKRG